MSIKIRSDYPGGNIVVENIDQGVVTLHQDMKGFTGWWYYWNFEVKASAGESYVFEFSNGDVVGGWGPAISYDRIHWEWLGSDSVLSPHSFQYRFRNGEVVYFAFSLPYTLENFEQFYDKIKQSPYVEREVLTMSEYGYALPLLRIGKKDAEKDVVVTCNHHAGDTTANYVMEGFVQYFLSHCEEEAFQRCRIHLIPFVDLDAVQTGEPGKVRLPHNHNQDYSEKPLYRAVEAIQKYAQGLKIIAFFDLHTSESRMTDESPFLAMERPPHDVQTVRYGKILEKVTQEHRNVESDSIVFPGYIDLRPDRPACSRAYFGRLGAKLVCGLEFPHYGNEQGKVTQQSANWFGSDMCKAFEQYLNQKDDASPDNGVRRKKSYQRYADLLTEKPVTGDELESIIRNPVLRLDGIDQPIVIKSIEMRLCGQHCLLIVKTKQDVTGISVVGTNWQYFYPILEKKLAPFFIGKDVREVETLFEQIYVRDLNYKIQGLAYWCCVAWLEASLLDILGKVKGVPLGALFGPKANDSVSYYCASSNRGTTPQEELEVLEKRITEVGAKAIKFKIGGRMSWDRDSLQGRSEELIVKAREYFGDEMVILADANGSFDPALAVDYGHMLEDIHAYFYEEPCRFDYLWETKKVADQLKIPIAFGEQETSLRRFRYMIENHIIGVVQPDIQYNGGFIRTCKVARMAEKAGITVSAHISGGIQYAYVLHLASFTPNMCSYQELKNGYEETKDLFTTPLALENGRIKVPEGVGLCMYFDDKLLRDGVTVFCVSEK